MTTSNATTVKQYLDELPKERRAVISKVRKVILENLPKGYRETMGWGMINYELPLERFPDTYNKKPLCYAALAAQKNHYALYLMGAYAKPECAEALKAAFARAGKKLDMGKSCLRFKKIDDLPLDAIGKVIGSTPPDEMADLARESRRR